MKNNQTVIELIKCTIEEKVPSKYIDSQNGQNITLSPFYVAKTENGGTMSIEGNGDILDLPIGEAVTVFREYSKNPLAKLFGMKKDYVEIKGKKQHVLII